MPRRTGTPEWSKASEVAQAVGYDVGLAAAQAEILFIATGVHRKESDVNKVIYWTTQEVADRYRTSPETVRYWRHIGAGPRSIKVGRQVLYDEDDLLAYERTLRVGA